MLHTNPVDMVVERINSLNKLNVLIEKARYNIWETLYKTITDNFDIFASLVTNKINSTYEKK